MLPETVLSTSAQGWRGAKINFSYDQVCSLLSCFSAIYKYVKLLGLKQGFIETDDYLIIAYQYSFTVVLHDTLNKLNS